MKPELYACDHCGTEYPPDELLEVSGDFLCPDCAAELTLLCDECGRRIYTDDDEGDDCRVLCRDCRDR